MVERCTRLEVVRGTIHQCFRLGCGEDRQQDDDDDDDDAVRGKAARSGYGSGALDERAYYYARAAMLSSVPPCSHTAWSRMWRVLHAKLLKWLTRGGFPCSHPHPPRARQLPSCHSCPIGTLIWKYAPRYVSAGQQHLRRWTRQPRGAACSPCEPAPATAAGAVDSPRSLRQVCSIRHRQPEPGHGAIPLDPRLLAEMGLQMPSQVSPEWVELLAPLDLAARMTQQHPRDGLQRRDARAVQPPRLLA